MSKSRAHWFLLSQDVLLTRISEMAPERDEGRQRHDNPPAVSFFRFLFVAIALLVSPAEVFAQAPKIQYMYDSLGRLIRVVNQANECATYEYDAVGNLLSITRGTNCLQPPIVDSLSQQTAVAGETTCITVTGTNFLGATVATDNPDVQISRVRISETSVDLCLVVSALAEPGTATVSVTTTVGTSAATLTIKRGTVVLVQNTTIGAMDLRYDEADLTIDGPVTVTIDGIHRFNSLTLRNGAVLTHSAMTEIQARKLDIMVTQVLQIDATSRIDVNARGYLGGRQSGNPFVGSGSQAGTFFGMTNAFQSGSTGRTGGSYAGLGGANSGEGTPNAVYGDFRNPNEAGSGGPAAASNSTGGNGGGLVRIAAGTLQLNGVIRADGGNGVVEASGGSGGGIRIDAGTLSGTGQITSLGGTGIFAGGGGGGRIAIYYQTLSGFNLANVTAYGGVGGNGRPFGGAGTVYLQGPGRENGELIIDNIGRIAQNDTTPLFTLPSGSLSLSELKIRRGAKAKVDVLVSVLNGIEISTDSRLVALNQLAASTVQLAARSTLDANTINAATSFQISDNSVVSHLATTGSVLGKLLLNTGTLTIDATSKIDVSARGFLGGRQPGNSLVSTGNLAGFFPGITIGFQAGSTGLCGGSYGGLGAVAEVGTVNPIYGDFADPNDPGSGGAADAYSISTGGNGGGQIRITANTVQLNGAIKADGGNGFIEGAGGSGGGIRIDTATLAGTGQISAAGGNGPYGGGGGGGRIAIYYQTNSSFNFAQATAVGGLGGGGRPNGNTGTVHLQQQIAG